MCFAKAAEMQDCYINTKNPKASEFEGLTASQNNGDSLAETRHLVIVHDAETTRRNAEQFPCIDHNSPIVAVSDRQCLLKLSSTFY